MNTQILTLPKKDRQLNAHHIPDDFEIDAQVAVNQLVAHGDELTPLNLGSRFSDADGIGFDDRPEFLA